MSAQKQTYGMSTQKQLDGQPSMPCAIPLRRVAPVVCATIKEALQGGAWFAGSSLHTC